MKKIFFYALLFCTTKMQAQELFPSAEPASAMSAKTIAPRIFTQVFPAYDAPNNAVLHKTTIRFNPEIMWGVNKKLMIHLDGYASNIYQQNLKLEGANIYAQYRFFANDKVQSHFRMAFYGRFSAINNPIQYGEINLEGDNSGIGTGIIATQLLHKIAFSFTGGYLRNMNNLYNNITDLQAKNEVNYSFSTGFLFLPFRYTSYKQPNLNLFLEFLGKSNFETNQHFLDAAPALQLILNSLFRIDFIYQKQLYGNMARINNTTFALRLEYNFLNAYK